MKARCLMVVGTSSHVGKSFLAAGLCRIFAQDGYRVAPFKAQNMALNSSVTSQGHEIGRAQVMQAEAANIEPHVDMNPILLKPADGSGSQVIVHGAPLTNLTPSQYYLRKALLWEKVIESFDRLSQQYEIVVIEGAGSPAEVNLKQNDIVNMRVALMAKAPTLLVGDIDLGGVFASLIGTLDLLEPNEQDLIKGLVINKFRGDVALFADGVDFLEERTGKPVLGILPYQLDLQLDEEDAVSLTTAPDRPVFTADEQVEIVVIHLPHISNFTDFAPLQAMPGVRLRYVTAVQQIGRPDAIIIPGTKNTLGDLKALEERGFVEALQEFVDKGTHCVGICGGFQMLGSEIRDPHHVESLWECVEGLNLLPITTTMHPEKQTSQVIGQLLVPEHFPDTATALQGYEIHQGQSTFHGAGVMADRLEQGGLHNDAVPFLKITKRSGGSKSQSKTEGDPTPYFDGAISYDGRVWGTYLHGIFDNDAFRLAFVNRLRMEKGLPKIHQSANFTQVYEKQQRYNQLAALVRNHLDITQIYEMMGI